MSQLTDRIFHKLTNFKVYNEDGKRSPHKPLLILIMLGRFQSGDYGSLTYTDIEKPLRKLIQEFGPTGSKPNPHYPFWRLQKDDIWKVSPSEKIRLTGEGDPWIRDLREQSAKAEVDKKIISALKNDKSLLIQCARTILDKNFPDTLHEVIALETGLDLNINDLKRKTKQRDPNFRINVLNAYNYHCAVCGKQIRLNDRTICIDAAHIKWDSQDGPPDTDNGIALCSLHHKLFDYGAFTIDDKFEIKISENVEKNNHSIEWLHGFVDKNIYLPNKVEDRPNITYLKWHNEQVFKGNII